MCIREPVTENRLEQVKSAREVPADVLKTALAQSEWEPGNSVKATMKRSRRTRSASSPSE
jgi:hypothetical protein